MSQVLVAPRLSRFTMLFFSQFKNIKVEDKIIETIIISCFDLFDLLDYDISKQEMVNIFMICFPLLIRGTVCYFLLV